MTGGKTEKRSSSPMCAQWQHIHRAAQRQETSFRFSKRNGQRGTGTSL